MVRVNWGDGRTKAFRTTRIGSLGSLLHRYGFSGDYTVNYSVTDSAGAVGRGSFVVRVANVPPLLQAAPRQVARLSVPTSFHLGRFRELGSDDGPWQVLVTWGDGQTSSFTVTRPGVLPRHDP